MFLLEIILSFFMCVDYDETKSLPPRVALIVQNLRKEYFRRSVIHGVNFIVCK